ncbi:MAG: hypothetical protein ACJ742_07450 [Actinomycetes bacterium]
MSARSSSPQGHKIALAARAALLDAVDLFAEVDAPYEGAQALLVLARFMDIHLRRLGRSAWTGR